MAPRARAVITTCEWMFDDAGTGLLGCHALATFNPLRWSGSQSFSAAVEQLEEVLKENCRPILIKAPAHSGDTVRLETVQQAIHFLKRCDQLHDMKKAREPRVTIKGVQSAPNKFVGNHTSYELGVSEGTNEWTTQRRYRDFLDLNEKLKSVPGYQCPALPPKGMVGFRHALNIGAFNQDRQEGLENYLSDLVSQVGSLSDVAALGEFLGVSVDANPDAHKNVLNQVDPLTVFGLSRPIFMMPKQDIGGDNGIIEVAFGESEEVNGVEVTVIFKDEDRPNHVEDLIYDIIRKPLFGRSADIETFTFLRGADGKFESVLFKGTYSGDQDWTCKVPAHMTETVKIGEFVHKEQPDNEGKHCCQPVMWVNVWNHLFGPKNNNPDMEMIRVEDYPCTHGTRTQVDKRYHGMITTVA